MIMYLLASLLSCLIYYLNQIPKTGPNISGNSLNLGKESISRNGFDICIPNQALTVLLLVQNSPKFFLLQCRISQKHMYHDILVLASPMNTINTLHIMCGL